MLVKCQCDNCSQPIGFEAIDAGSLSSCPYCGTDARLLSPPIPGATGERVGDGKFYVWLDDKPEGPLQSDQLLELAKEFSEMGWAPAGGSAWRPLSEFPTALAEARQKEIAELKKKRRQELMARKKEAAELRRDISTKMTAIRSEARRQSAVAGKTWLGLYDGSLAADQRRAIRIEKENQLLFLEQQKANADEILAKIETELEALEQIGSESTPSDAG